MSYYKKEKWEIIPVNLPVVRKNCSKCGEKTNFINTEKFRVNANGSLIDIWMIYQCERCKTSWKLTLHERIKPSYISKELYRGFIENDLNYIRQYAFHMGLHQKSKAELVLEAVDYQVVVTQSDSDCDQINVREIQLVCDYPLDIRIDKLLAEQMQVSRSKMKELIDKGTLYGADTMSIEKAKVKTGRVIRYSCNETVMSV